MKEPRKPGFNPDDLGNEDGSKNPVQAGCGALIGLVLPLGGGFIGVSVFRMSAVGAVVTFVGSAAICALLAWQLGDRFWGSLKRWWW